MIKWGLALLLLVAAPVLAQPPLRCGWWDNPSPGNVGFIGIDGQWDVAVQGVTPLPGASPRFPEQRWIASGIGSYGYGCVCFRPVLDREQRSVRRYSQLRAQPLSLCRRLAAAEPQVADPPAAPGR